MKARLRALLSRLRPRSLLLWLFGASARADHLLCLALKPGRLKLPTVQLQTLHPDADRAVVHLDRLPAGAWATPLVDVVYLTKLVLLRQPRSILELGCYKGETTALLARHADPQCKIVTVDIDPAAGEGFRNTELGRRIDLRLGAAGPGLFAEDEQQSFDLIFIDADHSYSGVKRDTELSLSLVSPEGLIVWHDYANWGYFSGFCHVPEYLAELSTRWPLKHLGNTSLALYSPAWVRG